MKAANKKHKPQKAITCFALIFTLTYVPQLKIITQLNNVRPGHVHKNKDHLSKHLTEKMSAWEMLKSMKFIPYFQNTTTKGQSTFVTK